MTYRQWTRNSVAYRVYNNASDECAKAFAPAPKPVVNTWVHPGTGERRLYINNLKELVGLELTHYKTGSISSASLNGRYISNNKAGLLGEWLGRAKVFIDAKGLIEVKAYGRNEHLDIDDLFEIVKRACTVHGITNK